ncbi:MAG TPA: glycosyl hydrolase family 28-related protein [bacterium]|nr:glycosyl hydrolase family 28-related protein [bacterium]
MAYFLGILMVFFFASGSLATETNPKDLEGVISVRAHGVVADGTTDDTAALQSALDEAGKTGGRVYLPPAQYLIKGSLKVPEGVTVMGVACSPHYSTPLIGTVILATGGRDDENASALFEMPGSTMVTGLTIYYPEQKAADIRPYPWTFHMYGHDTTIENVTLVNSYNGIRVGPEGNVRHRIRSVYGCVLRRGLLVDACTDIGRVDNVQFHGHWWWMKELGGDYELVNNYMIQNLEAFIFGRTDWEYVTNTFVFPVNVGYRFIQTPSGSCNGHFCGIGADYAQRCIVVDQIQHMGLLITNGQFVAFAGENPIEIEINETCTGQIRLVNCAFWGPSVQNVVSRGQSFLSLSDCFLSSDRAEVGPLVEVASGKIQIRGCSFAGAKSKCIALRKGVRHAIVTENNAVEGVSIINEIGRKAIIRNNEPPASKDK